MESARLESIIKQGKEHPFRTVLWLLHDEFQEPDEILGNPEIVDDRGIDKTREYVDKRDVRISLSEFLGCKFGATW